MRPPGIAVKPIAVAEIVGQVSNAWEAPIFVIHCVQAWSAPARCAQPPPHPTGAADV